MSALAEAPSPGAHSPRVAIPDRLLDFEDLSRILRIGIGTLRWWRTQNKLPPAVKVNGCVRFKPDVVAAWIDGMEDIARDGDGGDV